MMSKYNEVAVNAVGDEVIKLMADKAGVSPDVILQTIRDDLEGNVAKYFQKLLLPAYYAIMEAARTYQ